MWFEDSIPIGERFSLPSRHPYQPWAPPSLLYNGYRVPYPGVKRLGLGIDHPSPPSAEVKARVELYLYAPSGPLWQVTG